MVQNGFRKSFIWGITLLIFVFSSCSTLQDAKKAKRDGDNSKALDIAQGFLDDDNEPEERISAINIIGGIESSRSGELLVSLLDDENKSVVNAAIMNLGRLRYGKAGKKLVSMIPDAERGTFTELADAFGKIGEPATDILIKEFDATSNANRRDLYIKMFMAIGHEITDSLTKSLEGKSAAENRDKFRILVSLKNPKVAGLLVKYIDDEAIGNLVKTGLEKMGKDSAPSIIKELKKRVGSDENIDGTERLIQVLGKIKAQIAFQILKDLMDNSTNERIEKAADGALQQIGF